MEQKKYNWSAAVCTPKNYFALMFSGHLIVGNSPESGYVYMPFDRVINSEDLGDNDGSSSGEATGISPKILDITWMSFTENKSYSGIFKLDSEKIESLMINGSERPYWDQETKKVGIVKDYDFTINAGLLGGMDDLYLDEKWHLKTPIIIIIIIINGKEIGSLNRGEREAVEPLMFYSNNALDYSLFTNDEKKLYFIKKKIQ